MKLCECGCGQEVKPGRRFIHGHQNRGGDYWKRQKEPQLCECGCGELAKPGDRFIACHHRIGKTHTSQTKKRMSDAWETRPPMTESTKAKISETLSGENHPNFGKKLSPKTCQKISKSNEGKPKSPKHCIAISSARQGIPVEEWTGFISSEPYCPKFDEEIRQYIRDKYNNCDYMSCLPAAICNIVKGLIWKLSVHHVDYNKQQGCDDHEWRLIPLSQKNHMMTNGNKSFWNLLFTYSLQYDETYYKDKQINIMEMV